MFPSMKNQIIGLVASTFIGVLAAMGCGSESFPTGTGGDGGAGGATGSSSSGTGSAMATSSSTGCNPATKPLHPKCVEEVCENGDWTPHLRPKGEECWTLAVPWSECDGAGSCVKTPPPMCGTPITTPPSTTPGCAGGCDDGNPCTIDLCGDDGVCAPHYPYVGEMACPGVAPAGCAPGTAGCPSCVAGWCCSG